MIGLIFGACLAVQHPTWTPKTNLLPPEFVKTAQLLLEHGLPDIRGYELKQIESPTYMIIDEGDTPPTNICWVSQDGSKQVNFAGDLILNRRVVRRALTSGALPQFHIWDGSTVLYMNVQPYQYVQLIHLAIHGEERLVAKFMSSIDDYPGHRTKLCDGAFESFCGRKLDQSIQSFLDGDNQRSFSQFGQVIALDQAYDSLSGSWPRTEYDESSRNEALSSYLSKSITYRTQLNHEMTESIRWHDPDSLRQFPVQKQVSMLIEQLALLGSKGNNEQAFFRSSKTTDRLLTLDTESVPQLLEALDKDTRRTRSLPMFYTSLRSPNEPYAVGQVIRSLLNELALHGAGLSTSDDRLRAYWSQNLRKPLADRIYEELGNQASLHFTDAAVAMFENPTGVPSRRVHNSSLSAAIKVRPDILAALSSRSPSITELMFTRVNQFETKREPTRSIRNLISLARLAYHWNAKESLPCLVSACSKYILFVQLNGPGDNFESDIFGELLDARKALGDSTYLTDLENYAGALSSAPKSNRFESAFCVLNRIDSSDSKRIVERLFFERASTFNLEDRLHSDPTLMAIIGSPILKTSQGRAHAMSLLHDQTPIDTAKYQDRFERRPHRIENGMVEWISVKHFTGLRLCDLAASALRNVVNCPEFDLEWPPSRRDQAIPAIQKFVGGLHDKPIRFRSPYYW